jgi:predicted transcriptional regulator
MKRPNLPKTSLDANKKAVPEMRQAHHAKILNALKEMGSANYEQIAKKIGFKDRNQVSRRLKEMEDSLIIYKPGLKTATSSGRMAYVYCIAGNERSGSQIAGDIVNNSDEAWFKNYQEGKYESDQPPVKDKKQKKELPKTSLYDLF